MKFRKNILILLSSLMLIFSFSCTNTDDPVIDDPGFEKLFNPGEGFFILNEGAFGQANASVSYYHEDKDSMSQNVFENVNSAKIGDVLQSMKIHGAKAYIVVNNSALIKVVDVETFEEQASIEGFTSPRYIQIINDQKAYVSDLYANQLWVLDLTTNTISDSIELPGWTEEMLLVGNKVYVTSPTIYGNPTSKEVFVIDSETDELNETLSLKANPNNIILGPDGNIHIFCLGDPFSDPVINPSFYTIDPDDHSKKTFFNMPGLPVAYNSSLAFDNNRIYILYGSLYFADLVQGGLSYSSIPLVDLAGRSFYGLSRNPKTSNIFISDAKDFNQKGGFLEYKTNGVYLKELETGIAPSKIVFY